jgi:hypothetical protein
MSNYLSRSPVDPPTEDSDDLPDARHSDPSTLDCSSPVVNAGATRSHARTIRSLAVSSSSTVGLCPPSVTPLPSEPSSSTLIDDLRIRFTGDINDLRLAKTSDNNIQFIIDHLTGPHVERNYTLVDVILMHFNNLSKTVPRVLARPLRRDIMQIYHDTPPNAGHVGREKTLRKVRV